MSELQFSVFRFSGLSLCFRGITDYLRGLIISPCVSVQLLNIGGVRVPISYSIARCTERIVSALCHAGSASVGGTGDGG